MPAGKGASEVKVLCVATAVSLAGVAVYVLDRGNAVFFLAWWPYGPAAPDMLGPLGDHLPTLLHPLVFVLISAAVLRPWPQSLPTVCVAWFVIECLFELCQTAPLDGRIAAALSPTFDSVPMLQNTADYFVKGTFDPLDVLSIGIGTAIAYPLARRLLQGDLR